jgi:hypothetical protein
MIHHFELLFVPVLRNNTQLRDLCPVYSSDDKRIIPIFISANIQKASTAAYYCALLSFCFFRFPVCCDCLYWSFMFLNDSPLAQKEIY